MRKLQAITTHVIENMPIEYNIEEDTLYLKGLERGHHEVEMTKKNIAIECLKENFSYKVISKVTGLSIAQIEAIDKERQQ